MTGRARPATLVCAMCCAIGAALTGCSSDPRSGYSSTGLYDEERRTIAVPVFDNVSYEHGLEVMLTDAIVKEIQRTTPWRIVSTDSAETTLSGAITNVRMRRVSTARQSGLVQELAYELTCDYFWKDNRTGAALASRRGFRTVSTFAPAHGVEERIEVGSQGAVEAMARDIVASLRSRW